MAAALLPAHKCARPGHWRCTLAVACVQILMLRKEVVFPPVTTAIIVVVVPRSPVQMARRLNMQLSRKAEWATVIAMTLIWGFVGLNRVGISYLFPILRPLFHLNLTQVGLLISGTSITWAFSTLIGGYLSDHIGFKPIYLFCITIAAIFTSLMGAAWDLDRKSTR